MARCWPKRAATARATEMAAAASGAGARLTPRATAIGYYPEDEGPAGRGLLAVVAGGRLVRVQARRYLYATGGYDQNLPFADNDRPGVISARACGRLAFHWGVRPVPPKAKVIILDGAPTAAPLARGLGAAGVATLRVDLVRETVVGARGTTRVRGLVVESPDGARKVAGDLVAVATLPSPASELPRQHGAAVVFDAARGGFVAVVDAQGATTAAGIFACGDVTGYAGPEAAARDGAKVGRALAATLALTLALAIVPAGCAGPPSPPPVTPARAAATPAVAPPAVVQPPPFAPPPAAAANSAEGARTELRRSILDAAWRTVRDKHYDKTLGGLDWSAVRAKLRAAGDCRALRGRLLPRAEPDDRRARSVAHDDHRPRRRGRGGGRRDGQAGRRAVRRHLDRRAGGSRWSDRRSGPHRADHRGAPDDHARPCRLVRRQGRPLAGLVVTQIAGRPLQAPHNSTRALRPVEERFELRRAAVLRLAGPAGTRVTVSYLDEHDRPAKVVLTRDPPAGKPC